MTPSIGINEQDISAIRPLASAGTKLATYYEGLRHTTLSYSPKSVKVQGPLRCCDKDHSVA